MESARTLTRARYGAIATIADSGQLQDSFISGLTPEEKQQILDWPDGPRVFEHFRNFRVRLEWKTCPATCARLALPGTRWVRRPSR